MFTGHFFVDAYSGQDIPPGILLIPELDLGIGDIYFIGPVIGELNLMIWVSFLLAVVAYVVLFRTPANLRLRACGEHPRAADTLGIDVYRTRYVAVVTSGALRT